MSSNCNEDEFIPECCNEVSKDGLPTKIWKIYRQLRVYAS
jgi:hypothetical protein